MPLKEKTPLTSNTGLSNTLSKMSTSCHMKRLKIALLQ
jgi:hypothetical protein